MLFNVSGDVVLRIMKREPFQQILRFDLNVEAMGFFVIDHTFFVAVNIYFSTGLLSLHRGKKWGQLLLKFVLSRVPVKTAHYEVLRHI